MAKRKQQPDSFDVSEFLRASDEDMKSALSSILHDRTPFEEKRPSSNTKIPGLKLRPGTNLDDIKQGPGLKLDPGPDLTLNTKLSTSLNPSDTPLSDLGASKLDVSKSEDKSSQVDLTVSPRLTNPLVDRSTGISTNFKPDIDFQTEERSEASRASTAAKKRNFPIREMKLAQDGHTRAEQQVYQSLWENAKVFDGESRVITIGFGTLARLARLSESNARLNLRSLIAKLAIEEHREYNCELSLGRTYRIFNYSEILRRRKDAGLIYYMRRTLAVVFVNPETGSPIDLSQLNHKRTNSGPGIKLTPAPPLNIRPEANPNLRPAPDLNLRPAPPSNLGPLYREEELREKTNRESSSTSLIFAALNTYAVADDDVITKILKECRKICSDCTEEEIVHFIHEKGALIKRENSRISNPLGFLLTAVPKCLTGKSFEGYRSDQRELDEKERARHSALQKELEDFQVEQQTILNDPNASEEDKILAKRILGYQNPD